MVRDAYPYGLRPTLRQGMILVLYAALVSAWLAAVPRASFRFKFHDIAFCLILSVCMLGVLVRLLDRPGAVRSWISRTLLAFWVPAFILRYDLGVLRRWLIGPYVVPGDWLFLLVLNPFLLRWLFVEVRQAVPLRCPTCGRRAMLLQDPARRGGRVTRDVRECLACGGTFRKGDDGGWHAPWPAEPTESAAAGRPSSSILSITVPE